MVRRSTVFNTLQACRKGAFSDQLNSQLHVTYDEETYEEYSMAHQNLRITILLVGTRYVPTLSHPCSGEMCSHLLHFHWSFKNMDTE